MDNEDDSDLFPKGIKWYGAWESADYRLPRSAHIPCEVQFRDGSRKFMITVSGDWREVVRWRQVQLTAGELRRQRRALKIEAQEVEQMG